MSILFPNIRINGEISGNASIIRKRVIVSSTGSNISVASAPSGIDGVTLSVDDRILLRNQTASVENGIWIFKGTGSALVRAEDFYDGSKAGGIIVSCTNGTVNKGRVFLCTNTDPNDIIGTDNLTYILCSGDVYSTDTQTLTNKTITDSSNVIRASELGTSGSSISISASGPPINGHVLVASDATTASWVPLPGGGAKTTIVASSALISNTSTVPILLAGMTISPVDATYLVIATGDSYSAQNNKIIEFSIFYNGSQVSDSTVRTSQSSVTPWATHTKVVVSGGGAIEIRWKNTGSQQTGNCEHRHLSVTSIIPN